MKSFISTNKILFSTFKSQRFNSTNYIDFSLEIPDILYPFSDLINNLLHRLPSGHSLWIMPTAILYSDGLIGMRSISKQFQVSEDSDLHVIIDNIKTELSVSYYFYAESGDELLSDIFFQYWYRLDSKEDSSIINKLQSKAKTPPKYVDYLKTDNLFTLYFENSKYNIIPPVDWYTNTISDGVFYYKGFKFILNNNNVFTIPPNWSDKLKDCCIGPTIDLLDRSGCTLLSYKDYKINSDIYIRFLWKPKNIKQPHIYVIDSGDISYWEAPMSNTKFVTKLKQRYNSVTINKTLYEDRKFGVFDIETYVNDVGDLIPYAIGSLLGGPGNFIRKKSEINMFYLCDFKADTVERSVTMMMLAWLKNLLLIKNRGYKIYAHNLGGFDGPILLKYLSRVEGLVVRPLTRGGRIYEMSLSIDIDKIDRDWYLANFGPRGGNSKLAQNKKIRIILSDSYLMLPLSLRELGVQFDVPTQKGIFPHKFVNESNLNYIGIHPENKDIRNWSLRESCLNYLKDDLFSLYEILHRFEKRIRINYHTNMDDYISLPSLVFGIFRTYFMSDSAQIPIITGKAEKNIREAYRGGTVEIYKPFIKEGFCYDINSQYPAAMLNDMPVGQPVHCYSPSLDDFFGFSYSIIEAPSNINRPFLQTKVNGKIVLGLGNFSGWYFSEELKLAKKLGYKITMLESYRFDRGKDIFKNYVEHFFNLKKEAVNPGDRLIYKLFLNSFYGKWGMLDLDVETKIVDWDEFSKILDNHEIKYTTILNDKGSDNNLLVTYKKDPDMEISKSDVSFTKILMKRDKEKRSINTSVSIGAAITSYARISMYQYISKDSVAYTDTDSIYTTEPLPENLIGSDIGMMKLEHTFTSGLFVKPKVYYTECNGIYNYRFKGIPKDKVNHTHYWNLYNGLSVNFEVERLMKQKVGGIKQINSKIKINPPDDSKRLRLYDESNKWFDTKPIILDVDIFKDKEKIKNKRNISNNLNKIKNIIPKLEKQYKKNKT